MKAFAIACLLAAPVLSKVLAQTKGEEYAEPAADYEQGYDGYSDGASVSINSHSDNSVENNSYYHNGGSNYSVDDHDQYHNNEDNNQSPQVDYACDTTTQNVNFRINLLKQEGKGRKGHKEEAAYWVYFI